MSRALLSGPASASTCPRWCSPVPPFRPAATAAAPQNDLIGTGGAEPCRFFKWDSRFGSVEFEIARLACDILASTETEGGNEELMVEGDSLGATRGLVLDVGMNSGIFTQIAAAHDFEVISIEPQPACHVSAKAGLVRGRLAQRVRFVRCGAGDDPAATFNVPRRHCGVGTQTAKHGGADDGEILTHVVTIDSLVGERRVTWAKVDTEGSEIGVLRGASQSLQKGSIGAWTVEIIPSAWEALGVPVEEGIAVLEAMVGKYGYTATLLRDEHYIHSGWLFGLLDTRNPDKVDEGVGRGTDFERPIHDFRAFVEDRIRAELGANIIFRKASASD